MPYFFVRRYTDGVADKEPERVEAEDEQAAAEKVCGCRVAEGAKPGNLLVTVQRVSVRAKPKAFRRA